MINVRSNLFETNSSSVHAIAIQKKKELHIPQTFLFDVDFYGRSGQLLDTAHDRGAYLWTAINDVYYDNKKSIKMWKKYLFDLLSGVGCIAEFKDIKENQSNYTAFGIDHPEELCDFLNNMYKNPKTLRFLFGNDSFVIVGSDETDYYDEQYEALVTDEVEVFEKGN